MQSVPPKKGRASGWALQSSSPKVEGGTPSQVIVTGGLVREGSALEPMAGRQPALLSLASQ